MEQSNTYVKRNVECDYCGKAIHLAKDCFKRKNHESRSHESKQIYQRHNGNFVHKDTSTSNGFKNVKLFISEVALFAEIDDENIWFADSSASSHMSCNKEWYDEYYENLDEICI